MKLLLTTCLLLLNWFSYSQNNNFIIENNQVIWGKKFPTFQKNIIPLLVKNNKKINSFSDPSKGGVNNAVCDCSLQGFMNYRTLDFLFEIKETSSNYTMLVYNITFDVETELDFAEENIPIEQMILT